MAKLRHHTLIVTDEPGINLHGLVSGKKVHSIVWALNKILPFELSRADDLELTIQGESAWFIHYTGFDADHESEFHLIKNRGTLGYLIEELKQVDLILMERNYDCNFNSDLKQLLVKDELPLYIPIQYKDLHPQTLEKLPS